MYLTCFALELFFNDVSQINTFLFIYLSRCDADPDILPRTQNFGVDYRAFSEVGSNF